MGFRHAGMCKTMNRHGSAWWEPHSENGAVNRTSWFESSSRATYEQARGGVEGHAADQLTVGIYARRYQSNP